MLPALTIGATGCVDGPPNYAPELWVDIWNAYQDGDWDAAEAAQDRASDATLLARAYGLHSTAKFILSERIGHRLRQSAPAGTAAHIGAAGRGHRGYGADWACQGRRAAGRRLGIDAA